MGSILAIFFVLTVIIGVIASRKEDTEGYLIANRNLGLFQSVMTLCGSFIGAMTLLVYPAFVYSYGISALWIFIGYLAGFIFYSFFAIHLKKHPSSNYFYTMTDYFYHRFGRKVANCVIAVIFTSYFGGLTAQIVGSGKILSELSGLQYNASVLITVGVILIYVVSGGFKSVVRTDVFQFILMGILLLVITWAIRTKLHVPITHLNPFDAGPVNISAFFLLGFLGLFGGQDYWQKAFAIRDRTVAKRAFIISGILIFLTALILTYIGLIAKSKFPAIDPDLAILYSFSKLVPARLINIVTLVFFAAILSSADTNLFMLGLNVTNDLLRTKKYRRFNTRLAIIGIGLFSSLLALYFKSLVDLAIVIKSIGLILPSIVLFIWLTKGDTIAIIYSIIFTLITVIAFASSGFMRPELSFISIFGSIIFYWASVGVTKLIRWINNRRLNQMSSTLSIRKD